MKNKKLIWALVSAMVTTTLVGCASAPKSLYEWGSYEPQLYQHFKGESPEQQILLLEKDLEKIIANGNLTPPGYHAHLGLLYLSTGDGVAAAKHFQYEKTLFPESATYIEFLTKNEKKKDK